VGEALQEIVSELAPERIESGRLAGYLRRALRSVAQCRTAALGGHVRRCVRGHIEGVWYNSCGHRSCPRCGSLSAARWLEARQGELLACSHYQVVFTLPSELRELWQWNRRSLTSILFRSVSATLLELLGSSRHLGALPGVTLAFHSWSKSLAVHPHIHALVTAGGLAGDGSWKACRNGFLLPVRVLVAVFRGKLLSHFEREIRARRLRLPTGWCEERALRQLRIAARAKWSVWVAARSGNGSGLVAYLARYLRGGPIRDSRIRASTGGSVSFALRGEKALTLSKAEFLSRWLEHVPEPQTRVIRHYGLYAHTARALRELARRSLPALERTRPRSTPTELPWWSEIERGCSRCRSPLVVVVIPRGGAPPSSSEVPVHAVAT
jgi:hypothetical protein